MSYWTTKGLLIALAVLLAPPATAGDRALRDYTDRIIDEVLAEELGRLGNDRASAIQVVEDWASVEARLASEAPSREQVLTRVPWERVLAAVTVIGETGNPADASTLKLALASWERVLPLTARTRRVGTPLRQKLRMVTWESFYKLKTGHLSADGRASAIRAIIATKPVSSLEFQAHYLGLRQEIEEKGWSPPIENLLVDEHPTVRKCAFRSVRSSAPARVRRVLVTALTDPDTGDEVRGYLRVRLDRGDEQWRTTLKQMEGNPSVNPTVRAHLTALLSAPPAPAPSPGP